MDSSEAASDVNAEGVDDRVRCVERAGCSPGDGIEGEVYDVDIYYDGKIMVVGHFDMVNGTQRRNIARLLPNGQVDFTFEPGDGVDGPVHSVFIDDSVNVVGSPTFDLEGQEEPFHVLLEK